ncbi:endoribonuclease Dicer homolog 3a isoform X4 [Telopea speciosissima]|uniref:endoribonuclease Dicer homolog 3a isoform X4 n=1 Tax=Telopea speciosissima TaxID=54955 RepID=UPI001CC5005D|nr:endoribonuclease Dicer homolog 3a isoform X4 [Telopea speciosissima]
MASSTELNPLKRSFEQLTESESKMSPGDECEVTEANGLIPKEFNARSYQKKVFQVALRKNTIAMLETGAGKTMIAVMLIKEIGQAMKMNAEKKLIIFLAPTVHLVNQQFEVIKIHTNLKVEEYYGAKKIDEWSAESWEKEIRDQDVMVMTPQILLDALRKAFMTIEMVCLMIFDESHRAIGNHPYTKIMKEFYHKSGNKPKIFGMTASPVVRKGVSSSMDCEDQISELECILDSKICTIEDKAELELYVPSAKEITRYYDPISFRCEDLKAKLNSSLSKSDALLVEMQGKLPSQFKDTDEIYKKLRKRLSNHHSKILHCLDDLGLICAHEAAKVCLENVPILGTTEEELYRASFLQCKYFLEEVLRIIEECLPSDYEKFLDVGTLGLEALEMGFISPKLYELIQIFQSLGGTRQILCLIFVERIITAKVIERFIKKLNYLSHFSVSYLTGGSSSVDALTPKMQKKTLDSFRRGEVNLLFATNVAEEGIDVPNCSSIIRFDLPKTVRSYVQSRGRARQPDSQYVTMLERGNIKQRDLLFEIIRSDRSVTDTTLNRDPNACISRVCCVDETSAYVVESTGASVTADSSIGLIYRYCEKLPGDKYYTPKPNFQFSLSGGSYEYTLSLPPNAAFQKVVGPANRNSHISKQLVCLEACKKLHQMGALDDHLLPYIEDPSRDAVIERTEESASGAGTTKRKELHGSARVRALSGTWGGKPDGVILQAYKVNFSCNLVGEFYSGFVLLIDSKLDDEVANAEVELYLIPDKLVKSSVFPCGEVHLDAEQVKKSMCFQGFFFNGLFLTSKKRKEYLIKTENKSLWCSSNMYLLLPLELPDPASHESVRINWRAIDGCASVVNFLKEKSNFSADHSFISEKGDSLFSSTSLSDTECKSSEVVHLANVSVNFNDLVNMVVVAVHTGRIYSVLDVMIGTSAESPFDLTSDAVPSNYSSFREYFNKKYGILLMHPGQPLLLLKQSHNAHNLLLAKPNEGGSLCKETPEAGGVVEKPQNHVHMPPELLVSIGVSINVLKTFYLLPSLMHRLESLMLACQLREEIACHPNDSPISSSLILEALTTLRCCEKFSLERLELLGDSVLKYAVSCHLFLRYPKKHEGQLSARRSWAVCNSTLHKLGTNRKIQVLGDMVESIAGAILIDTKLNLDEVWRIFRPLLSPIVTPDKLELPPLRQLHELCDHLGYFIKEMCVTKGDVVHAELRLQLKDVLLKGEGCERNRKAAKGRAALHLLKDLEQERGVSHSLYVSKQKKLEPADGSSFMDMAVYHHLQPNDEAVVGPVTHKKLKTIEDMLPVEPPANNSLLEDGFEKVCDPKLASPVSVSINLQKGGPRSSLYQLCRMLQWPMPTFHSVEHKSRVPIEFGEGSERRTGFSSFISKISLHIPNNGVIELTGDQKADKKSSFDSAALLMLYELGRQGRCVIGD